MVCLAPLPTLRICVHVTKIFRSPQPRILTANGCSHTVGLTPQHGGFLMKSARLLAAALAISAFVLSAFVLSAPARAQTVDLSKTSCKEFLASGKDGIVIIWAWLYGYY